MTAKRRETVAGIRSGFPMRCTRCHRTFKSPPLFAKTGAVQCYPKCRPGKVPLPRVSPMKIRGKRHDYEADRELAAKEEADRRHAAEEVGRMNGLVCTGTNSAPDCEEPAGMALVVDRKRLVGLPCLTHSPELLRGRLEAGQACQAVALVDMLGTFSAEALRDAGEAIRYANGRHHSLRG